MLQQRIITALVLVALVLVSLLSGNALYWRALISIAVLIGFWEWLRFCDIEKALPKVISYCLFGACFYALQSGFIAISIVVPALCVLWCVLLMFTLTSKFDFLHNTWLKLIVGILVLSAGGLILIEMKFLEHGALWVLCFMVSVWAADVGAYFSGKRFGKTKLAPKVSPGKTVEGLLGGVALVLLIYVPVLFYVFPFTAAALLLLTVVVSALISVGGDLFESKMKRFSGLKDSSQVLPGHGGVLDRIDSLLSGAPFFAFGLILLDYLR